LEAQLTEENPVAEIYKRKKAKSKGQEYLYELTMSLKHGTCHEKI